MTDKITETRARYRYWLPIATRWMDGDPYGHVNNVQYYSFIDTVVTTMLIERQVLRGPHWNAIGLAIESHCNYHAPITFPDHIDAGLRIGRIGNSSLRYEVGLFLRNEDTPAATGHFVHVFVDPQTRRPVPLVEPVRAAMAELTLPPA
ncbi:MAG: acyl-CoA thioesterase [Solimonas sp.]